MYELKSQPPLPHTAYRRRVALHALSALALLVLSLGVGMVGYHGFERLSWIDSFLNASMLLGGMGPVDRPLSVDGKLFAGLFALYSGLVFLVVAALIFAPVFHRVLHRFHWNDEG
jgi:hypothetical protein